MIAYFKNWAILCSLGIYFLIQSGYTSKGNLDSLSTPDVVFSFNFLQDLIMSSSAISSTHTFTLLNVVKSFLNIWIDYNIIFLNHKKIYLKAIIISSVLCVSTQFFFFQILEHTELNVIITVSAKTIPYLRNVYLPCPILSKNSFIFLGWGANKRYHCESQGTVGLSAYTDVLNLLYDLVGSCPCNVSTP